MEKGAAVENEAINYSNQFLPFLHTSHEHKASLFILLFKTEPHEVHMM